MLPTEAMKPSMEPDREKPHVKSSSKGVSRSFELHQAANHNEIIDSLNREAQELNIDPGLQGKLTDMFNSMRLQRYSDWIYTSKHFIDTIIMKDIEDPEEADRLLEMVKKIIRPHFK